MRILVVTQHFWPEDFRINELSKDFIEKGHHVTVLTGHPNYPEGKTFPEYKKNRQAFNVYNSIEIKRIPIFSRGRNKLTLAFNYLSFVISGILLGPIILRKKRFDLIFVFEPSPITVCIPAIFLKYIKKAKLALWVLDLWPQSLYAVGYFKKDSLVIKFVRLLVKYIYSRCDLILGTSNSFVQEIKKDCNSDNKIKYFPNWYESIYDTENAKPAKEIISKIDDFNLMFAGNLGDAQDLPTIVNGMKILKDFKKIKLYILGDGKRYKWLKQFIIDNDLSNNIFLLGRHSNKRMPEFFAHANAMLVSLKPHEIYDMTIPGKLQSYLISRKPIIGLIGGESAKIIESCNCGLVSTSGNSEEFAKNIQRLYKMKTQQRDVLAKNGYQYAKSNFNKESLFNSLESWLTNT